MKYIALIGVLLVFGCSSSVPQDDEPPKTWTVKEVEPPKDKPVDKKPDRTDLFFGPDELLPVDYMQDESNPILTLPKARALLGVIFTTSRDRIWDEQADLKIWDKRGKTYLEMSFPKSADKRTRKFELVRGVDNKFYTRWANVWGPSTLLQYGRRSLDVYWGEQATQPNFTSEYAEVRIKLYNTHRGTIIDHSFPVTWSKSKTTRLTYCQDLGTAPKKPMCLPQLIIN